MTRKTSPKLLNLLRFSPLLTLAFAAANESHAAASPRNHLQTNAGGPALIATNGSERATTGAGNKIVTFADKTHVVWQKSAKRGYFNKIRTLDRATGEWSKEFSLNEGVDNHARPVITVDREGHLHVVLSGHNSTMSYRRSLRPNDGSEWGPVEAAGVGTYPSIACGRDNRIFMAARAHGQKGADFYIRTPDGKWSEGLRLVKRAKEYSGYAGFTTGLTVDRQGTLHFICNVYEGKSGKHQALCYMRSPDEGKTWRTAAGNPVKIPARPEDMDLLLDDSTPRLKVVTWPWINSRGNIVADSQGSPFVAYVSHVERPGEVILASADKDGQWTQRRVTAAENAFSDLRPMGVSVALSIDSADTLHLLLELTPLDDGWTQGKPLRTTVFREEPVKRLVLLSSRDRGKTFKVQSIVKPGAMFNMATMERPTGVNELPAGRPPPILYFDGTCRYPKPGEFINNNVFLVAPK
ncbi:MAG: hypothetical protein ACI9VS_001788 [Candidatus Binatia bacterium]|jgi:hypothetical protein